MYCNLCFYNHFVHSMSQTMTRLTHLCHKSSSTSINNTIESSQIWWWQAISTIGQKLSKFVFLSLCIEMGRLKSSSIIIFMFVIKPRFLKFCNICYYLLHEIGLLHALLKNEGELFMLNWRVTMKNRALSRRGTWK